MRVLPLSIRGFDEPDRGQMLIRASAGACHSPSPTVCSAPFSFRRLNRQLPNNRILVARYGNVRTPYRPGICPCTILKRLLNDLQATFCCWASRVHEIRFILQNRNDFLQPTGTSPTIFGSFYDEIRDGVCACVCVTRTNNLRCGLHQIASTLAFLNV